MKKNMTLRDAPAMDTAEGTSGIQVVPAMDTVDPTIAKTN